MPYSPGVDAPDIARPNPAGGPPAALSPHGAVEGGAGYPGMRTAESRRSRIPDCIDSG